MGSGDSVIAGCLPVEEEIMEEEERVVEQRVPVQGLDVVEKVVCVGAAVMLAEDAVGDGVGDELGVRTGDEDGAWTMLEDDWGGTWLLDGGGAFVEAGGAGVETGGAGVEAGGAGVEAGGLFFFVDGLEPPPRPPPLPPLPPPPRPPRGSLFSCVFPFALPASPSCSGSGSAPGSLAYPVSQ